MEVIGCSQIHSMPELTSHLVLLAFLALVTSADCGKKSAVLLSAPALNNTSLSHESFKAVPMHRGG